MTVLEIVLLVILYGIRFMFVMYKLNMFDSLKFDQPSAFFYFFAFMLLLFWWAVLFNRIVKAIYKMLFVENW